MATLNVLPTPSQHPHPHPPNPSLQPDDDVYNNTLSAPEQHIKARTPPPAYASLSPRPSSPVLPPPGPGSPSPPSSSEQSHSSASSSSSQQTWPSGPPYSYNDTPYLPASTSHSHPEFGPTPLTSGHPLLAVPHAYIGAPGAADRRARWRFVGGLFCAVVLLMGASGLVGLGLVGEWGGPGPRPSRGRVCWGLGAGC